MTRVLPGTARGVLAVVAVSCATAAADHIIAWPGSGEPAPAGLFSRWRADQRKVRAALRQAQLRHDRDFLARQRERVRANPARLDERVALAHALWRSGRLAEAVAQFRVALALDPASIPGRRGLAELLRRCGRTEAALAELRELVAFHRASRSARLELARQLRRAGRTSEAVGVLRELTSIAPGDPAAATALASLLIEGRHYDEARAELDRAAKLDGENPEPKLLLARLLRRQGRWAEARRILGQLARGGSARARLELALLELHERRFDEARRLLEKPPRPPRQRALWLFASSAVALARGDHDGAIALAKKLRDLGEARAAASLLADTWLARGDRAAIEAVCSPLGEWGSQLLAAYEELLAGTAPQLRPRLALHLALVGLYRMAGWHPEAIAEAQQARKLRPENVHLARLLASCYRAARRPDDELALRKALAAQHPDLPSLGVELARCELRRGDYQAALATCRDLVGRHPGELEARLLLARLAARRGDYSLAAQNARAAVGDHPRSEEAWQLLVSTLVGAGDVKGAAAAVRRRAGADPAFAPGTAGRAVLAIAEAKWDEALDHCERGLAGAEPQPVLHYLAGLACERGGRAAEALRHYMDAQWQWRDQLAPHLAVARVASGIGRYDVAAAALRAAMAAAPARADLRLGLARALLRAGRGAEALEVLDALKPTDARARLELDAERARARLAAGAASDALALAEKVLTADPAHRGALEVALEACRRLGTLERAVTLLERIRKKAPAARLGGERGLLLLLAGRPQEAMGQAVAEARLGTAAGDSRERVRLGRICAAAALAAGKVEQAAAFARSVQAARRADAPGSPAIALILAAAGAAEPRDDEVKRVERTAPWRARWLRQAFVAMQKDRRAAALAVVGLLALSERWHARSAELLDEALGLQPDLPLLLEAGAVACSRAGRGQRAIALARKLVEGEPKVGHAHLLLGALLEGAGEKEKACEAYWRAVPLLTRHDVVEALAAARLFGQEGRSAQAIETYQRMVALDPHNPLASNNLAWLLAQQGPGKLAEAEKLAAAAVAASPNAPSFRDTLGWLRFLRRDYAGARAEILEALARRPTKAVYFYHLGMVEFAAGRPTRAERALRLALKLEPEMAEAATARATLKVIEARKLPGNE